MVVAMTKAQISDIQAVVLCGPGHRLITLVDEEKMPKCMLPIANRPMLYYPLNWLHRSGIHDVIVVANTAGGSRIQNYLSRIYDGPKVELVLLEEYQGTMDALQAAWPHLRHDFIVLGCDLLTDYPLGRILERWRICNDIMMLTVLATPPVLCFGQQPKESTEPKHRLSDESGVLVGLDSMEKRLLTWILKDDIEDSTLNMSMALLTYYPQVRLCGDLTDVHLYLFRYSLVEMLFEGTLISGSPSQLTGTLPSLNGRNLFSIRQDLVPKLVRKQMGSADHYRCEAIIINTGYYCMRTNTLSSYAECGKQLVRILGANNAASLAQGGAPSTITRLISQAAEIGSKTQIGADSMIGDHSRIGDRSSVKRSIVGNHVNIGNNVKISNSVILDHVIIEDGVKLEGSIVGVKAHIREKSFLKDCDVGPEYIVERESTIKGETLGGSREIYLDMADSPH